MQAAQPQLPVSFRSGRRPHRVFLLGGEHDLTPGSPPAPSAPKLRSLAEVQGEGRVEPGPLSTDAVERKPGWGVRPGESGGGLRPPELLAPRTSGWHTLARGLAWSGSVCPQLPGSSP